MSSAPPASTLVVRRDSSTARETLETGLHLIFFEVRKSHVGSALGLGWAVTEPLLFVATYYFLFAIVLKVAYAGPGGSVGHLLSMFSGLVPWLFFSNCLGRGVAILRGHVALVKQINFPISLLPAIMVAQVSVEFVVSVVLMILLAAANGLVSASTLILVPATLLLVAFLIPCAYLLSCYDILLPDVGKLIPTVLRVGIFVTPVLYLPVDIPEKIRFLVFLNPMSYFIVPFRYAFLKSDEVLVYGLATDMTIALGIVVVVTAVAYLHRNFVRSTVVDYL